MIVPSRTNLLPQQQQQRSQHQQQQAHSHLEPLYSLGDLEPSDLQFRFPISTAHQQPQQQPFQEPAAARLESIQTLIQVPELMPSESSWLLPSQTPRGLQRLGHHRESSLSSLGSNGPPSPYNANTSNPHIAVPDSSEYNDVLGSGDGNYSYQLGKSVPMNENFYTGLQNLQGFNQTNGSGSSSGAQSGHAPTSDASFSDMLPNSHKPKVDRGLLPVPELSGGTIGHSGRSQPVSVASSIAGDSPATPSMQEPEEERRRKNVYNNIPKLDRTMTDVYNDELYSPNFTITSASPASQTHMAMSPSNDLFNQRLQAANSQHLNAAQSPLSASSRGSPFRQDSPFATTLNDFSMAAGQSQFNSAQHLREKRKAEQDARAQQHMVHNAQQHQHQPQHHHQQQQQQRQQGSPNTISPKDAVLEFHESDDNANNFPLFPSQESTHFNLDQLSKSMPQANPAYQAPSAAVPSAAFNFSMPTSLSIPQQYPFIARPQQHGQQQTPSASSFSRMTSADTSASELSETPIQKPTRVNADGGTYTCTYHGCTQRFESPALLQKHKREGHRQANALSAVRASPVGSMNGSAALNSQAGPHRCDRINPSTGKPCSTVFSRPYDLTRHEDTIHNPRKQKVRCQLCTEEKTFSRADALTRHFRVCHPDVEFPGKHRRRGGITA